MVRVLLPSAMVETRHGRTWGAIKTDRRRQQAWVSAEAEGGSRIRSGRPPGLAAPHASAVVKTLRSRRGPRDDWGEGEGRLESHNLGHRSLVAHPACRSAIGSADRRYPSAHEQWQ